MFVDVTGENLVGEPFFLPLPHPPSWIGLNELKWGDFYVEFIKGILLQLTTIAIKLWEIKYLSN